MWILFIYIQCTMYAFFSVVGSSGITTRTKYVMLYDAIDPLPIQESTGFIWHHSTITLSTFSIHFIPNCHPLLEITDIPVNFWCHNRKVLMTQMKSDCWMMSYKPSRFFDRTSVLCEGQKRNMLSGSNVFSVVGSSGITTRTKYG
jgi:hypothetical protein